MPRSLQDIGNLRLLSALLLPFLSTLLNFNSGYSRGWDNECDSHRVHPKVKRLKPRTTRGKHFPLIRRIPTTPMRTIRTHTQDFFDVMLYCNGFVILCLSLCLHVVTAVMASCSKWEFNDYSTATSQVVNKTFARLTGRWDPPEATDFWLVIAVWFLKYTFLRLMRRRRKKRFGYFLLQCQR